MRLYPHLYAVLNYIAYDKRHDARPVPSDGNLVVLTLMFCLSESDTFYLYPYPTDMRKSFYSLSGIVINEMKRDVQDGEAFIFVNRSLTSMKILHAEYGGLVIYNLKL